MAQVNKKNLKFMCEIILSDLEKSNINSIIKYDNANDCVLEECYFGKDGDISGKNMYELMKCNTQMKMEKIYSKNNFFCPDVSENSILEKVSYYYISGDDREDSSKDENGYKAILFDYDVSLRNILIYGIVYGNIDKEGLLLTLPIKKYEKYKYEITIGDFVYRGDTMNSLNTVLGNFFSCFDESVPSGRIKRSIYLLENSKYYNSKLPDYVNNYLSVYNSIGNMFMAPKEFNSPRYNKTSDYWDLTLLGLYNWFSNNDRESNVGLIDIIGKSKYFPDEEKNIDKCKKWLSSIYKDEKNNLCWNKFIERNFLRNFVDECGVPIELWNNHFIGAKKGRKSPQNEGEFKAFFENTYNSILERGKTIADKLINK
ncbi:hypothetical protein [Clostridium saccharoperbutylacetonicum]